MELQEHRKKVEKLTYSIPEACKALGVGRNKMLRLVRLPGFPSLKIGGTWTIPIKPLEEWLHKQVSEN
jgi:excisionase family DNA binding protein